MKIVQENLENQVALLKVAVEAADYSDAVEKQLKAYKKSAKIPGYRPGMVPMGLINKMYRKGVVADEAYKVAYSSLYEYLRENKIRAIGDPLPSETQVELDFDNSSDFEFAFEIGLAPVVDIDLSNIELLKYDIEPSAEIIDSSKDSYLRRYGKLVDKDVVTSDEALSVTLDSEEMTIEDAYVGLISMSNEERAPFIGKVVGDKMDVNIEELYKEPSQRAAILSVDAEELEGIDPKFTATITRIRKFENPEITEDFFKEAFADGSVKNEEEFNNFIISQIKNNLESESTAKMVIDAKETLVKAAALTFPDAFVKRWLHAVNEGKFSESEIEKEYPSFVEYSSWANISDFYAAEGGLSVSENEIKEEAAALATMQFAYYGMSNPEPEMVESYVTSILGNKEEARRISDSLLTKKCVEYVATKANVKVETISYADFAEMAQKAQMPQSSEEVAAEEVVAE